MVEDFISQEKKKENIWNLPNFLTFSRVIIAFFAIYFIFAGFDIIYIVVAFVIGMLTDYLDGLVAKKFGLATEFGRKFDMVADRILIFGVAFVLLAKFTFGGILTESHIFQILFMLSREILTLPMGLTSIFTGAGIPQVRFIGKITTFLQSITFPAIMLSIFYEPFGFSIYLAVITGTVGFISGLYYVSDMKKLIIDKES